MHTLNEMKELLATQFDEVALLEIFNVNSYDIVSRFSDLIEDDPEKFERLLEIEEEEE